MNEKKSKHVKLYEVYSRYKKVKEVSVLSDFIRRDGLSEVKWPNGLRDELADLLDAAYPWSGEKRLAIDDSWIFYIYWSETEYKTGKIGKNLKKKGIREVEKWFSQMGNPKKYEFIQSRLRQYYATWRESLTEAELSQFKNLATKNIIQS